MRIQSKSVIVTTLSILHLIMPQNPIYITFNYTTHLRHSPNNYSYYRSLFSMKKNIKFFENE